MEFDLNRIFFNSIIEQNLNEIVNNLNKKQETQNPILHIQ